MSTHKTVNRKQAHSHPKASTEFDQASYPIRAPIRPMSGDLGGYGPDSGSTCIHRMQASLQNHDFGMSWGGWKTIDGPKMARPGHCPRGSDCVAAPRDYADEEAGGACLSHPLYHCLRHVRVEFLLCSPDHHVQNPNVERRCPSIVCAFPQIIVFGKSGTDARGSCSPSSNL